MAKSIINTDLPNDNMIVSYRNIFNDMILPHLELSYQWYESNQSNNNSGINFKLLINDNNAKIALNAWLNGNAGIECEIRFFWAYTGSRINRKEGFNTYTNYTKRPYQGWLGGNPNWTTIWNEETRPWLLPAYYPRHYYGTNAGPLPDYTKSEGDLIRNPSSGAFWKRFYLPVAKITNNITTNVYSWNGDLLTLINNANNLNLSSIQYQPATEEKYILELVQNSHFLGLQERERLKYVQRGGSPYYNNFVFNTAIIAGIYLKYHTQVTEDDDSIHNYTSLLPLGYIFSPIVSHETAFEFPFKQLTDSDWINGNSSNLSWYFATETVYENTITRDWINYDAVTNTSTCRITCTATETSILQAIWWLSVESIFIENVECDSRVLDDNQITFKGKITVDVTVSGEYTNTSLWHKTLKLSSVNQKSDGTPTYSLNLEI